MENSFKLVDCPIDSSSIIVVIAYFNLHLCEGLVALDVGAIDGGLLLANALGLI
jgi:hypothetical protein